MNPKLSEIQKAEIVEVYIHYDRPLLFSCRDKVGQKYISVLVEEDDDENETWLYVPVSQRRFEMLRSGGIDLHTAFSASETGYAYVVKVPAEGVGTLDYILNEEITAEWLPDKDARLNLETHTLPEKKVVSAANSLRDHISLKFDFYEYKRSEAPAYRLGEILCNFQETVDDVVALPAPLRVVAVGPGSFEIELEAETQINLLRESRVGEGIQKLLEIIKLVDDDDKLAEAIKKLNPEAAKSVGDLAKSLTGVVRSTEITWDSPVEGLGGTTKINSAQASKIYQEVSRKPPPKDKIITVTGILTGLNIDSKRFRLISKSGIYDGRIQTGSLIDPNIRYAKISNNYLATIQERIYENRDDSPPTVLYYLVRLDPIE
jgi:hypothetical protein